MMSITLSSEQIRSASFAQDRLEGYRLADIHHLTRLQTAEQVISCLEHINESLHRIRGTTAASFYGIDGDYIRRPWFEVIGRGNVAAGEPVAPAGDGPAVGEPPPARDNRSESAKPAQPS